MEELVKRMLPIVEGWLREIIHDEVMRVMEEERTRKKPQHLYTRYEVCRMAHISLPTLWKRVRDGMIVPVKIGRRVLFTEDEVKRFLSRE